MDEELRKLLEEAKSRGASQKELVEIATKYHKGKQQETQVNEVQTGRDIPKSSDRTATQPDKAKPAEKKNARANQKRRDTVSAGNGDIPTVSLGSQDFEGDATVNQPLDLSAQRKYKDWKKSTKVTDEDLKQIDQTIEENLTPSFLDDVSDKYNQAFAEGTESPKSRAKEQEGQFTRGAVATPYGSFGNGVKILPKSTNAFNYLEEELKEAEKIIKKKYTEKKPDNFNQLLVNKAKELKKEKLKESLVEKKQRNFLNELTADEREDLLGFRETQRSEIKDLKEDTYTKIQSLNLLDKNLVKERNELSEKVEPKLKRLSEISNMSFADDNFDTTENERQELRNEYETLQKEIVDISLEARQNGVEIKIQNGSLVYGTTEEFKNEREKLATKINDGREEVGTFYEEIDLFDRSYNMFNVAGTKTYTNIIGKIAGTFDYEEMVSKDILEPYAENFNKPLLSAFLDLRSEAKKGITKDLREHSKRMKGTVQKDFTFAETESFDDYLTWMLTTGGSATVDIAPMVVNPSAGLTLMGASSAGNKYNQLQKEIQQGADYSVAQVHANSTLTGLGDMALSAAPTIKRLRGFSRAYQATSQTTKKKGFKGFVNKVYRKTAPSIKSGGKESIEEGGAEVVGNVADILFLGKDKGAFDGVAEPAVAGAFIGMIMPFAGNVSGIAQRGYMTAKKKKFVMDNYERMVEIEDAFNKDDLSDESIEQLKSEYNKLVQDNQAVLFETTETITKSTKKEFEDVKREDTNIKANIREAKKIKENPELTVKEKKKKLKDLKESTKESANKKEQIIDEVKDRETGNAEDAKNDRETLDDNEIKTYTFDNEADIPSEIKSEAVQVEVRNKKNPEETKTTYVATVSGKELREGVKDEASEAEPVVDESAQDVDTTQNKEKFNNVTNKASNNQSINEVELEEGINEAYDALAELEGKDSEDANIMRELIENEIEKLENYDNVTKTETRKVAEEKTTRTVKKTRRKTTPKREVGFVGKKVKYRDNKGGGATGVVTVMETPDGKQYYVLDTGERKEVTGAKAKDGKVTRRVEPIKDDDLRTKVILGEVSKSFKNASVNIDKDGNPASVTFEMPDGKQATIQDKEVAENAYIEQSKEIEYDEEVFEETYIEFTGEEKVEVPKQRTKKQSKDAKETTQEQSKSDTQGKPKKETKQAKDSKGQQITKEANKRADKIKRIKAKAKSAFKRYDNNTGGRYLSQDAEINRSTKVDPELLSDQELDEYEAYLDEIKSPYYDEIKAKPRTEKYASMYDNQPKDEEVKAQKKKKEVDEETINEFKEIQKTIKVDDVRREELKAMDLDVLLFFKNVELDELRVLSDNDIKQIGVNLSQIAQGKAVPVAVTQKAVTTLKTNSNNKEAETTELARGGLRQLLRDIAPKKGTMKRRTQLDKIERYLERVQNADLDNIFKGFKTGKLYDVLGINDFAGAYSAYSVSKSRGEGKALMDLMRKVVGGGVEVSDLVSLAKKARNKEERAKYLRQINRKKRDRKMKANAKIYLTKLQKQYDSNPNATKELETPLELINNSIKYAKEMGDETYTKDLDVYKEVYRDLPKRSDRGIDVDAALETFDKNEKSLYNIIEDFSNGRGKKMAETISQMEGKTSEMYNDYVPVFTKATIKSNGKVGEVVGEEDLVTLNKKAKELFEGKLSLAELGNLKERQEVKTALDLNFVEKFSKQIDESYRKYHLTPALKTFNGTIKKLLDNENIPKDSKFFLQAVRNNMAEVFKNEFVATNYAEKNAWVDASQYLDKIGYTLQLTGVFRQTVDFSSNFAFSLYYTPAELMNGLKSRTTKGGNSLKDLEFVANIGGSNQTPRMFISSISQYQEAQTNQMAEVNTGQSLKDAYKSLNEVALGMPDRAMSILVWEGTLNKQFYKKTGKALDAKRLKTDNQYYESVIDDLKASIKEADKVLSRSYASLNPFERSKFSQLSPEDRRSILTRFDKYMTSFQIGEYSTLVKSMDAMRGNRGDMSRKKGGALFAATLTRMGIYNLGMQYAATTVMDTLMGMFGYENQYDDEEEEKIGRTLYRESISVLANAFVMRRLGNIDKIFASTAIEALNVEVGFDAGIRSSEDYNFRDSLTYSFLSRNKEGELSLSIYSQLKSMTKFLGARKEVVESSMELLSNLAKTGTFPQVQEAETVETKIKARRRRPEKFIKLLLATFPIPFPRTMKKILNYEKARSANYSPKQKKIIDDVKDNIEKSAGAELNTDLFRDNDDGLFKNDDEANDSFK